METIISIKNLKKSFKEVNAVDDISFKVKKGELFSFLGINGAGKSTTISMICGALKPDFGEIIIDGINPQIDKSKLSDKIGVVFQNTVLDVNLSVFDNLYYRGCLYGFSKNKCLEKIESLSNLLDFKSYINRPIKKLSGGQKRRIDIARALLNDPKILILDEPTTGLDPQTRKLLWNVITSLREKENLTVFLTTHYMEEANESDYIVIIDKGKIIASGSPLELKNKYTLDYITIYNAKESDIKKLKLKYHKIRDAFKIEVQNTLQARNLIIANPNIFVDFEITKGDLDDVFLNATGKNLRGEK